MTIDQLALELGTFRATQVEQNRAMRQDLREIKNAVVGGDGEGGLRKRVGVLERCLEVVQSGKAGMTKGLKAGIIIGCLLAGAGAGDLFMAILKAFGG